MKLVKRQSVVEGFHSPAMLAAAGENRHRVEGRGKARNGEQSNLALIDVELAAEAKNWICLLRDIRKRMRRPSSRVKELEQAYQ